MVAEDIQTQTHVLEDKNNYRNGLYKGQTEAVDAIFSAKGTREMVKKKTSTADTIDDRNNRSRGTW